ncbi:hypothetical protein ES705_32424 [subsurface metagenome]
MTERIRLEVDDAELDAVIARIDNAILKKVELLTGVPRAAPTTPRVSPVEGEIAATIERLKTELVTVEDMTTVVEANVEMTVDRLTTEILAVEQEAAFVSTDALMKLFAVETQTKSLRQQVRDLPNVDRATRMILLRIPGLREVLRLLYIVKMEERTLRLGEVVASAKAAEIDVAATIAKLSGELSVLNAEALVVEVTTQATINRITAEIQAAETQAVASLTSLRGPVTVGVTLLMYALMAVQGVQQKQERMAAQIAMLHRDMDQRFITMEEAIRGQGMLPERYRSTIPP